MKTQTRNTTPSHPALYARLSKREKKGSRTTQDRLGIERQKGNGLNVAVEQGWPEPVLYVDDGHSAWSGAKRPDFERLLIDIDSSAVDAIVIGAGFDRLTRNVEEMTPVFKLLRDRGIRLWSAWEGELDLSTAEGRKRAIDMVNAAEFESSRKSERTRDAKAQLASMGTFSGGMRPYGFLDNGIDHHPVEAPALHDAVEDILEGQSINSVGARLGLHRATFRRILRSPRIAGLRVHQGEIVGDATWKPIVERERWEQLQRILTDPRRKTTKPGRSYLLAGMVFTDDGRRMISRPETRRLAGGRTQKMRRYLALAPKSVSVTAEPLEAHVVDAFLNRPVPDAEVLVDDSLADHLRAQIVTLEAEQVTLDAAREADLISFEQWLSEAQRIKSKLEEARAAMPALRPKVMDDLWSLPAADRPARWKAMTFDQQRTLLASRIDRVVIARTGKRGRVFDTDRISIEWR